MYQIHQFVLQDEREQQDGAGCAGEDEVGNDVEGGVRQEERGSQEHLHHLVSEQADIHDPVIKEKDWLVYVIILNIKVNWLLLLYLHAVVEDLNYLLCCILHAEDSPGLLFRQQVDEVRDAVHHAHHTNQEFLQA